MKERNYYTENQGMMLSAMNAVTVWAIEQSITGSVRTGEESSEKANTSLVVKEEYVLLAANDDGTITDAGGGIKKMSMDNPLPKIPSISDAFKKSKYVAPIIDIATGGIEAGFCVSFGVASVISFLAGPET